MNLRTPNPPPATEFHLEHAGQTIAYTVTRSNRRRKSISISVSSNSGVRVAAPVATSERFIRDLVAKRAPWILGRLSEESASTAPRQFHDGDTLPLLGKEVSLRLLSTRLRRVKLEFINDTFQVSVPADLEGDSRDSAIHVALARWYRLQAESSVTRSVTHWSAEMNLSPKAVLVRDQRRRWGSCAPDGTLRFNWRLILAESAILDYVVVHELAHLAQRNHSPAFWAVVERFMPDHKARRKRLREAGPRLTV